VPETRVEVLAGLHHKNIFANDARRAYGVPNANRYGSEVVDIIGAPEEIRTPDPQIRSLVLYPAELRARCASRGKGLPLTRLAARAIAIGSVA
jgi:hypothetical protein